MRNVVIVGVMAAACIVPGAAQGPAAPSTQQADAVTLYAAKVDAAQGDAAKADAAKVDAVRQAISVQTRITPGAPYSAEAVTESTQTLADGNRIASKSVTRIYRDSEGRTRREQVDAETGMVTSVSISDPVNGASFTLDPANRVAVRNSGIVAVPLGVGGGFATARSGGAGGRGGTVALPRTTEPTPAGGGGSVETTRPRTIEVKPTEAATLAATAAPVPVMAGGGGRGGRGRDNSQTTREDLGQQSIEGVPATGSRSTTVIPAGAIGNLQPIKVISEQWMSSDLKVLVMTRHADPRSGETVYRLVNIVRAEPDRSLFTVPADYTVKDGFARRQQ